MFGIKRQLKASFEETLERLPGALKAEGFGVLTEIDIQSTLKQKLGVDFRRYKIFGACNPPFALEALQANLEVGLMLPCNVIVYESDDKQTIVEAIDPTKTMAVTGDPKLQALAEAVRSKLSLAIASLE